MTTNTTPDEIFKQKSICHKLASQDPVKLVCAPPKSSGQALVHYFCQNSTLSNLKKFNKTPVSILSRYCIQTLKTQTQLQCNIFSSCNPLPFNNWELSLPLRLPDYVSHSLVKMLSQTKLIVLPLQTKTNRHPNKNQCKII